MFSDFSGSPCSASTVRRLPVPEGVFWIMNDIPSAPSAPIVMVLSWKSKKLWNPVEKSTRLRNQAVPNRLPRSGVKRSRLTFPGSGMLAKSLTSEAFPNIESSSPAASKFV